jgi:hypothetical protein
MNQVAPSAWRTYVLDCRPDVVVALSDTPFTKPPYSQRRLTKSIQRSTLWLSDMLRPLPGTERPFHLNVLVHMAGGTSLAARAAFAEDLKEILHGKEAEACKPLKCFDDGVAGYVFDLVPLRSALSYEANIEPTPVKNSGTSKLLPLVAASLTPLSHHKLRLVNSTSSPQEILLFIQHIGIDLFDARWAQGAADIGVALDFQFPVPDQRDDTGSKGDQRPKTRANGKLDLGHNLYDSPYAHDFSSLTKCRSRKFHAVSENETLTMDNVRPPVCQCMACSPTVASKHIAHSSLDGETFSEAAMRGSTPEFRPPFTRAYLHHLLHTHEMSAHSLLTLHNLEVMDTFFVAVRAILALPDGSSRFGAEVQRFVDFYDEGTLLLEEATIAWKNVDVARGKGRLARAGATQVAVNTVAEL